MGTLRLALVLVLASAGCEKAPPGPSPDETSKKSAPVEGAMCAEHGVLEAICTKCNPRLIPVFQAKGDWCAEHGFPESVCPICHPERGGKPDHAVTSEKAPRDGLRVTFKRKDTAGIAGIEWVRVLERKNTSALVAPARLAYDATRLAQVNARSPGVVKALNVDVGAKVKKGQALLVIDSPNVGADRARLEAAKSRVATGSENLARQKRLVAEGLAAQQTLLAVEQELAAAKAEERALAAALSILGAGGGGLGGYTLRAPLDGIVTERRVTIGRLVHEDEVLLEIVDTRAMWADLEVADGDLPRVAVGQEVRLTFQGLGELELQGTIAFVSPAVDPQTRTAKVRVPLENPDGVLRANMFGQGRVAASDARSTLSVPRAAIQRVDEVAFVFVRLSETEFETRRVKLGQGDAQSIEVTNGLKAGEDVVTIGSFLLKTETSKESIGAGCCEND
jgi:cobalt-zinc-cadmium efflux system membrane fusion protein